MHKLTCQQANHIENFLGFSPFIIFPPHSMLHNPCRQETLPNDPQKSIESETATMGDAIIVIS